MASLPQSPVFELCGEEPMGLERRGQRARAAAARSRREQTEELARIVEGDIIPRLMIVHRSEPNSPAPENVTLSAETIEKFALYTLSSGRDSLMAIIGNLLQQGTSLEAIYLDLLTPVARRLGDYWADDLVTFSDVTIALGRLQQVVRELSVQPPKEGVVLPKGRSALFSAAPGEQHTFGLLIIEEFFRRSGWRTWMETSGALEPIIAAVEAHKFDVFGLTASADDRLDLIAPMIMSVRRASRNRDICVLVGGRLFIERPELAAKVGADHMAVDAKDAVLRAEVAVRQLARL
jgi:MerR family transcriptional regulator, light-induced transcriptional regulator